MDDPYCTWELWEIHFNMKNMIKRNIRAETAKGQLISIGLFKVFLCTKKKAKYFCIFALNSKIRR